MNEIFLKWLLKEAKSEIRATKHLYVLVGPPAVGKTSWISTNIEDKDAEFIVISRDQIIEDQIFPKYKLTNNELYAFNPPKDAEVGKVIPGLEKFGIVITRSSGRKEFSNVAAANAEIENLVKKEYESAIRMLNQLPKEAKYNVVIDAINATPKERGRVLSIFNVIKDLKKVAVYFKFEEYKKEIKKRAATRAKEMKKQFGYQFDRAVPEDTYEAIFRRIEKPTEAEGFDDVITHDSFEGLDMGEEELTTESIVRNFRDFLEEARLSKVFRREAKQKAKRSEEKYGYKHRKWAEKRQKKWNTEHPELEELYLKEIENATAAAKAAREYLQKRRELRKKKLEEKEKARLEKPTGKKRKTLPNPYSGEGPETKNFPYKKSRTGGVAKVYQKRAKKAFSFAQGESIPAAGIAPMAEEVEIISQQEEKGDGK